MQINPQTNNKLSLEEFKAEVLNDYKIAVTSRECSLLGRREVLSGKAKFGIFGDGKEVPQLAWAKAFKDGDWRSGYYRDQTFMMAIGELTIQQFFAGLYAHTDIKEDHPAAVDGFNNFIIITINILKKLIIVRRKPVIVDILNGTMEKLVKTLNHKETNLNIL